MPILSMHLAAAATIVAVVGVVAVIGMHSMETVRYAMSTNTWVRFPFPSRKGEDVKDASAVEDVVTVSGNMNH